MTSQTKAKKIAQTLTSWERATLLEVAERPRHYQLVGVSARKLEAKGLLRWDSDMYYRTTSRGAAVAEVLS